MSERDAFDNLPEEDRKTGEKQHSKIFDLVADAAFYFVNTCPSVREQKVRGNFEQGKYLQIASSGLRIDQRQRLMQKCDFHSYFLLKVFNSHTSIEPNK